MWSLFILIFLFRNIGITERRRYAAEFHYRFVLFPNICKRIYWESLGCSNSNGTNPIAPEAIGDRRHRKPTKMLILRIYASRTNCRSNLFSQSNLRMYSRTNDSRWTDVSPWQRSICQFFDEKHISVRQPTGLIMIFMGFIFFIKTPFKRMSLRVSSKKRNQNAKND